MHDIVILQNFEIYIPKEAEVKTTPIQTLPNCILRRMREPCSQGSRATRGPPLATWISPVVIRDRRSLPASPLEYTAKKNLASLVALGAKEAQGPFLMPFISSNYTAFKVLTEFLPEPKHGTRTLRTPLPQGHPPPQDTIIIHHGRIFLSIAKAKTVRGKRQRSPDRPVEEPPQTSQAGRIYLSPARKRPKKPHIDKELLQSFGLTRRVQVTLFRISSGDLEPQQASEQCLSAVDTLTTEQVDVPSAEQCLSAVDTLTTEQVDVPSAEQCLSAVDTLTTEQNQVVRKLLNANRLSTEIPGGCLEREEEFMTQGHKSLIGLTTSCQRPCSNVDLSCGGGGDDQEEEEDRDDEGGHDLESVNQQQVKVKDGSKDEKQGGAEGPAPHGEEPDVGAVPSDTADALNEISIPPEAVNADQSMDIHVCDTDYVTGDCDKVLAMSLPSSTQTQYHGFDFEQSAREERINRIRAQLREREAALNHVRPPR